MLHPSWIAEWYFRCPSPPCSRSLQWPSLMHPRRGRADIDSGTLEPLHQVLAPSHPAFDFSGVVVVSHHVAVGLALVHPRLFPVRGAYGTKNALTGRKSFGERLRWVRMAWGWSQGRIALVNIDAFESKLLNLDEAVHALKDVKGSDTEVWVVVHSRKDLEKG